MLALQNKVLRSLTSDPLAPQFVGVTGSLAIAPEDRVSYEFLTQRPFEGGKMWVSVWSTNHYRVFLFDIENRVVLGELLDAQPVFLNHDQSRVLCMQRIPAKTGPARALAEAVGELVQSIGFRNYSSHAGEDREYFWALDLRRNSASRLGRSFEPPGVGSTFQTSPQFRYGCNKPGAGPGGREILICDLEKQSFRRDLMVGWPVDWWDDQRLMVECPNNDFELYDVVTRKSSTLITLPQLKAFYAQAGLTNDPAAAHPFFRWTGWENAFYLTDGKARWSAAESVLISIERPDGGLKLLDPRFKFEWSDHFDLAGDAYLYSGREAGQTNSAVYLRDWKNRQTRELVPPSSITNEFSQPQFYRGDVIYVRSNALWRIKLDGTENRRLFPPSDARP